MSSKLDTMEDTPTETNKPEPDTNASSFSIFGVLFYSPVNVALMFIVCVLIYKLYTSKFCKAAVEPPRAELPKLRKDMTAADLRKFNGTQPDGRVLVAVNGWIFDVTKATRFYGPGKFK